MAQLSWLLSPAFIGKNHHRYYSADQLITLAKIVHFRQMGFPIAQIRELSHGTSFEAYGFILKHTEENKYEVSDAPRERYIDGIWNKDDPSQRLAEIQMPVK